jgi:predicted RNA-binding protein
MTNYYCLVTSDSLKESAIDIFNKRIEEKKYPLYPRTPNLNEIKDDDEVMFYIAGAGKERQSFVGQAIIQKVETPKEFLVDPDKDNYEVIKYLWFKKIKIFETSKNIQSIIDKLDFVKNKNNYGTYLMGGVKKLTQKDFNLIIS